jgi:membrane-bound acyltransferase YfiQ involved in biofilm formation
VILGEKLTKKVLILILFILNGVTVFAIYAGEIRNEWIILSFSLALSTCFLVVYSPAFENSPHLLLRKMREIVLSWEYAIALAIRACVAV